MERDPNPDGTGKPFQINEFELANRLSYFLWASMPDDELFQSARDGKLRENLDDQIKRMLKDPKAISLTKDFLGQWLEIRSIEKTPNCAPELLSAMKGETENFFNYIVYQDRSIMDFLDADYTFLNEPLAKHYGILAIRDDIQKVLAAKMSGEIFSAAEFQALTSMPLTITGNEFHKVKVDTSTRGGIFTQASFLTITSKPLALKDGGVTRRTSPVNRGKWILENIFNETIPPPPPNVPSLEIDGGKELTGTVRQVFEQHRADPHCAQCHERMDPYGFALENYDGFGAWRTQDNKIDVDASGEIDGKKFTTPKEFRAFLATRRDDFRRSLVEKLLSYALGRGIEDFDKPSIDAICAAVEKDGNRFSSVILNLARCYPFQHARGSITATAQAKASRQVLQEESR
jgi:hypothetical protein